MSNFTRYRNGGEVECLYSMEQRWSDEMVERWSESGCLVEGSGVERVEETISLGTGIKVMIRN